MNVSVVPRGAGEYLIRTFWDEGYVTLGVVLQDDDGGWRLHGKKGTSAWFRRLRDARHFAKNHDWCPELRPYGVQCG